MSCILGTGLNTCNPTKLSGRPAARARAAIESEEVVVARYRSRRRMAGEIAEERDLMPVVLDHRFDEERGVGQRAQVGHDLHALGIEDAVVELGQRLRHPRPRPSRRAIRAGPQHHLAGAGRRRREPARDGAGTCDSEPFFHGLPYPCCSVGRTSSSLIAT